jgi:hypothetical protein
MIPRSRRARFKCIDLEVNIESGRNAVAIGSCGSHQRPSYSSGERWRMAPDSVVRFANGVYMGSDGVVLNSVADEIKSPTDQAYKRSRAR